MNHRNIVIIIGHPAQQRRSFCEALARAYQKGALEGGHTAVIVKISDLIFDPILHEGYKGDQPPEADILAVQEKMANADHWVFVYPLWQFMLPALFKGFCERVLVKGFAYNFKGEGPAPLRPLKGKTARIIQTMGMPNIFYRFPYMQHGAKAFKNMLRFCGVTCRATYCGLAENPNEARRKKYLYAVEELGRRAA